MQTNAETMDETDEEEDFDLMNLTDEERAALLESDDDEGDDADERKVPDQSGEEGEEEQDQQEQEGDSGDEGSEDDAQEAEGVVADEPVVVDEGPSVDERIASINAARQALSAQYDDGELDTSEYMDQREELQRQSFEISLEQRETKMRQDLAEAESQKQWQQANEEFFKANSDYNQKAGLRGALQVHYNNVHNDPKFAGSSIAARLAEAKRLTDEELGYTSAPAPVRSTDADAAKRDAMKGRGKAADNVRPGLADIPAAAGATPESSGKYAHIDALEGVEHEAALAKLSEADLDAYLASED